MKKHHHTHSKKHKHSNPQPNEPFTGGELEQIASELDALARRRKPDGVLQDELKGHEDDIRQEAVLLALSWFLRQKTDKAFAEKYPWHTAKAISAALKIQQREVLKALLRDERKLRRLQARPAASPHHPVMKRPCDWSDSTMESMVTRAIRSAMKQGRISSVAAAVGLEVLSGQVTANELAKRLGTSRGNVYQHLTRVRRQIKDIIETMEVPFIDSL